MAIYKMVNGKERLDKVAQTSFGKEGLLERADLQRVLRDQPDVLEDGLLIVSEEFGNWQDSNRRIDLLGLDAEGRLVVVELKRGETGEHMELQAIRYAAMVANMTFEQLIDTYQVYLEKRAEEYGGTVEEDEANTRIREHLKMTEPDNEAIHTDIPRLILASENFGRELTTCVMWLNDSWLRSVGQEIKCIRLQPHRNGDEILIETSVVIPLPEAADYQTRLGKREQETRVQASARSRLVRAGDLFNESIIKAQEKFQSGLKRLYDCAVCLEERRLAELFTYVNGKGDYVQLQLRIPGRNEFLASFNNLLFSGGLGEISLWTGWNENAPEAISRRMDELVGPVKSLSGVRHRRLSTRNTLDNLDKILTAITETYQEFSGDPPVESVSTS